MYGQVGAPEVNVAREIDRPWCWIELNTRRPVSEELRESRITSTRGDSAGAPSLSASSLRTSGKAMPGSSTSSRSEEHTSELQSLMRLYYADFCLTKKQTPIPRPRLQITHS